MITEVVCSAGMMFAVTSIKNLSGFTFTVNAAEKKITTSWSFENAGILKAITPIQARVTDELLMEDISIWSGEDSGGWPITFEAGKRYVLRYGPAYFLLKDCKTEILSSSEAAPAHHSHPEL